MVGLNAPTHHLRPQAVQARERAQIRAIKDSIGHVEVFQMDSVGTPIIRRARPLPGHDTPTPSIMKSRFKFDWRGYKYRTDFVPRIREQGHIKKWTYAFYRSENNTAAGNTPQQS